MANPPYKPGLEIKSRKYPDYSVTIYSVNSNGREELTASITPNANLLGDGPSVNVEVEPWLAGKSINDLYRIQSQTLGSSKLPEKERTERIRDIAEIIYQLRGNARKIDQDQMEEHQAYH